MLKPTIFREYDIRGVAETELKSPDIIQLGRGLGTLLQRKSGARLNLGRDCRLSSPRLHEALLEGLLSSGCDVTDVGVVPTPLLYFSAVHLKADGAIMITGSHNPAEFNGFKTVCGSGTLHGETIQEVRKLIEAGDFASGVGTHQTIDVSEAYLDAVAPQFQFARRINVVADAGNGTAGPLLHRLLGRLNCDVTELFFNMDGSFPNHHPDPTVPENLKHLQDAVLAQHADLGIAFDGDSDRIGAVDENGEVIYGDMLLLIYGREILTRKPGATFIGEVKCSQLLYDELARLGGNPIMYKTGHSLIKAKMKEEHAELAGEMSGHMFFADRYFGYDDALYAACRLMEIVAQSGKPLSAQLAGFPKTVSTPEIRVDCPDETKFQVVAHVAEQFKKTHKIIDVDGVRVLFNEGWGLLRASNTQPVLVMRFEAPNEKMLEGYRHEVESALEQAKLLQC
ncbi:MAG TPA: phosphomannomutase/phosphoglucomutase [Bryobacteraceae bacterium]|jgi:phosphomannomutase/phosphoglucomutase|nr:phosphomannomutase/phosphoglucomutase [Bryobacteraceae bacterium]